jgi:hypothetical protein
LVAWLEVSPYGLFSIAGWQKESITGKPALALTKSWNFGFLILFSQFPSTLYEEQK